jgi:hypothetical protein
LQLPVAMERKAKRRNRREQQKLEEREGHEEGGQEHERLHVATSSLLGRTSSAAAWPLRHPYLPSAHRGGGDRRRGGSGRRTVAPPLFCFSAGEQPGLPLLSCGNTMPPLGGAGYPARKVPAPSFRYSSVRSHSVGLLAGEEEARGRRGSSPRRRCETKRCTTGSRASARPLGTGRPRRVLRRQGSRRWERAGVFLQNGRLTDTLLIGVLFWVSCWIVMWRRPSKFGPINFLSIPSALTLGRGV